MRRHAATLTAAAGIPALPPGPNLNGPSAQVTGELRRYLASYHRHDAPPAARSRYCPPCLAESGGVWPVSWSQPLNLVCVTHQVMLHRSCPDCRRPRFASTAGMTHDTAAWVCSEPATPDDGRRGPRTRYPVCGRDLRTVPTPPVDERAVSVQLRLWAAADAASGNPDEQAGSYAGFPVSNRDLFDAVLSWSSNSWATRGYWSAAPPGLSRCSWMPRRWPSTCWTSRVRRRRSTWPSGTSC